MKIFLGVSGHNLVHKFAAKHDCGWLMTPYNCRKPPLGLPHCLDNGRFSIWLNEQEGKKKNRSLDWEPLVWDPEAYRRFLSRYSKGSVLNVVPDIVIPPDPRDSIRFSESWFEEVPRPRYLAVQDRMRADMVIPILDHYDGLFVGGSIRWKHNTMQMWCDIAHLHKKKCHVARIWGWEVMCAARMCGADSIDSTSASRHQDDTQLEMYHEALKTQSLLTVDQRIGWEPIIHQNGKGCGR